VGKVMASRLDALGLHRVGDLRALGRSALEGQFGRWGGRLFELSLGIDERAVEPNQPTQSISSEDTFATDLPLEQLDDPIRRLAERTWQAASKERQRVGRTVVLKVKTADFRQFTRSHTPTDPPASAAQLIGIALALSGRVAMPAQTRFRLVGVGLGNFVDRADLFKQGEMFGATLAPAEVEPLD
jgi:DNA polymerase-4